MTIKSIVLSHIEQVAKEQNKLLAPLMDDLPLLESGLDSLCFAIAVARLEDVLGVDPFSTGDDIRFPLTLGDLIKAYENAPRQSVPASEHLDVLSD